MRAGQSWWQSATRWSPPGSLKRAVSDRRRHGRVEHSIARIRQPVTWIYGTFDKWVDAAEVRDVMSIASPGDREVVEIPTGHNLHDIGKLGIPDNILRKPSLLSPEESAIMRQHAEIGAAFVRGLIRHGVISDRDARPGSEASP